jgi:hypothetical protein
VITLAQWLAAIVAAMTALAMLADTPADRRIRFRGCSALFQALSDGRKGGWRHVDRAALGAAVRHLLRVAVLVTVFASAGMCVLIPGTGLFDSILLVALVIFLAMQAPCPWLRWILFGPRPPSPQDNPHAH